MRQIRSFLAFFWIGILVLITPGSHSNDDESKRFDTGFDYLVQFLAENGYIAVSGSGPKAMSPSWLGNTSAPSKDSPSIW